MKSWNEVKKEMYAESPDLETKVQEEYEKLQIGIMMKEARKAAGMTQQDVAEIMRVNRSFISQLEGQPQNITLQTLMKYSHAVGGHMNLKIAH